MNTQQPRLAETAVLMRLSAGLPGKTRKDRALSDTVKSEKGLGANAGAWIKQRWPDWALEPLEKLITKARSYHDAVTLPFDSGIGILPAALIKEYGDRMRQFKGEFDNLRDSHFKVKYPDMVAWARKEHNGTFDETDYPVIDELLECFHFATEPLPVPDAAHFEGTLSSLLGVDADSVNVRVADAMQEAQRELMRRLIEPVRAMATKLSEAPQTKTATRKGVVTLVTKDCPTFRDTLVSNLKDIAALAPKLNIAGDKQIDAFVAEIKKLTVYEPDTLRTSTGARDQMKSQAAATLKALEAYKI